MTRKNTVTTKNGDQGYSRLFSGEKVLKDSPRVDAYGDIDELISLLGITRCHTKKKRLGKILLQLQRDLFVVGSELATTDKKLKKLPQRVDQGFLDRLERQMELSCKGSSGFKGFTAPGGNLPSAYLDYARAVARRCERKAVSLLRRKEINNQTLVIWLNRLSDFLYILARAEDDQPIYLKR